MIHVLLDIDGVMNTIRNTFDDGILKVFNKLIEKIKLLGPVKIILSSNWRMTDYNIQFINCKLSTYGLILDGITPLPTIINQNQTPTDTRIHCIRKWVENNPGCIWMALDDLHCEELGENNFCWINPTFGLTENHFEEILTKLKFQMKIEN